MTGIRISMLWGEDWFEGVCGANRRQPDGTWATRAAFVRGCVWVRTLTYLLTRLLTYLVAHLLTRVRARARVCARAGERAVVRRPLGGGSAATPQPGHTPWGGPAGDAAARGITTILLHACWDACAAIPISPRPVTQVFAPGSEDGRCAMTKVLLCHHTTGDSTSHDPGLHTAHPSSAG